jgi:predicted permease
MALGASPRRIVRAALTESLALALLGATLGIGLAYLTADLIAGVLPATFSVSFEPDVTVLAFACALAVGTALLFGLLPALRIGRVDVSRTLKGDEGRSDRSGIGGGLVVAQVAVAMSLAAAAGLTARSFATASAVPLGYQVEDRILLSTTLSEQGYSEEAGQIFVRRALEGLRAVPGVLSASTLRRTPFYGGYYSERFAPPGGSTGGPSVSMGLNTVSPDFFRTMGIEVMAGRPIDETDVAEAPSALVVSASAARSLWPDSDPVGQRLLNGRVLWEVVGVVEDTRVLSLDAPPELYGYTANAQDYEAEVTFVVHGDVPVGPLREVLHSLDPGLAISPVWSMRDVVNGAVGRFRTPALLVGVLGSLALILAIVGLHGVLSYSVVRARKDIGIRVALGASSRRVARIVVLRALRLTAAGLVLGGMLAFAGSSVLASFLYGIGPRDPGTWTAALFLILVVAVASSLAPALRAARVDPMEVLRAE